MIALKDNSDNIITNRERILKVVEIVYEGLYSSKIHLNAGQKLDWRKKMQNISEVEIDLALNSVINSKVACLDSIFPKMLQVGGLKLN